MHHRRPINVLMSLLTLTFLKSALAATSENTAISPSPDLASPSISAMKSETQDSLQNFSPNLRQGNITISAFMGTAFSAGDANSLTYFLSPSAEYFIKDRFSVGGTLQGQVTPFYRMFGLGPSFSYYFHENDRWASYAGGGINYRKEYYPSSSTDSRSYWASHAKLGLNYFIVPQVSVGPTLTYQHIFANGDQSIEAKDTATLLLQFAIHL